MKNHDSMKGLDIDTCPVHGTEIDREYHFGQRDTTVWKWECGCCACQIGDALNDDGTYHTNYPDAAGRARLGVAIASLPLQRRVNRAEKQTY